MFIQYFFILNVIFYKALATCSHMKSCKLVTLPLPNKSLYNFVWTLWSNIVALFGLITLKIDTLPYFKAPFQAAPMDIRLLLFRALY